MRLLNNEVLISRLQTHENISPKYYNIKKAECPRIDIFELWCWRRLESPLDSKDIQPVHPNGNQSWILIERTDAEAPNLWSPDAKN